MEDQNQPEDVKAPETELELLQHIRHNTKIVADVIVYGLIAQVAIVALYILLKVAK